MRRRWRKKKNENRLPIELNGYCARFLAHFLASEITPIFPFKLTITIDLRKKSFCRSSFTQWLWLRQYYKRFPSHEMHFVYVFTAHIVLSWLCFWFLIFSSRQHISFINHLIVDLYGFAHFSSADSFAFNLNMIAWSVNHV